MVSTQGLEQYLANQLKLRGQLQLRDKVYRFLHAPCSSMGASAYALSVMLMTVASVALYLTETVEEFGEKLQPYMLAIDGVFLMVFTLDVVARVASCREWSVLRRETLLWVEFATLTPLAVRIALHPTRTVDVESSAGRMALQLLDALAVLRLLRCARYYHGARVLRHALVESASALAVPFFFLVMTCAQAGGIMYALEGQDEHESSVSSAPDAMWLVLCTVTTLGYGERYPVTAAGRLVMGVVLLVGLTMIAMPLAIIGARFTDRWDKRELSLIVHELEAKIHAAGLTGEATLAAFRKFDADLSGTIEWGEFRAAVEGELGIDLAIPKLRRVFGILDDDGSGTINYYEFCIHFYPDFEVEKFCASAAAADAARRNSADRIVLESAMASASAAVAASEAKRKSSFMRRSLSDTAMASTAAAEDALRGSVSDSRIWRDANGSSGVKRDGEQDRRLELSTPPPRPPPPPRAANDAGAGEGEPMESREVREILMAVTPRLEALEGAVRQQSAVLEQLQVMMTQVATAAHPPLPTVEAKGEAEPQRAAPSGSARRMSRLLEQLQMMMTQVATAAHPPLPSVEAKVEAEPQRAAPPGSARRMSHSNPLFA